MAEGVSSVTSEVVVEGDGASGRGRLTVLRLSWRPDDPLAVALVVTAQPDHPALPRGRWICLRDSLRAGLDEPTGSGQVRVAPDRLRRRIVLELARGGRPCRVSLPREVLRAFLDETERVVPIGAETGHLAVDALIERLLAT